MKKLLTLFAVIFTLFAEGASVGKRASLPLVIGPMYSAGDAASTPDGTCRLVQNQLHRPNRVPSRPPFTYDGVMSVNGLANWDDPTNNVTRLVSIDTSHATKVKSATLGSETWGGSVGSISGTRLTDYTNYRGKVYAMFDDGAGLPSGAASYDGTTLSTSPFNSAIAARTVTTVAERLFLAYPRVTFTPPNTIDGLEPTTWAYDFTSSVGAWPRWVRTNVNIRNVVTGTTTVCRLFPTSTAANACQIYYKATPNAVDAHHGMFQIEASSTDTKGVFSFALRPVDGSATMPMTLEVRAVGYYSQSVPFAVAVGDIYTSGGYMYRVVTAGNANGTLPSSTTLGTVETDGTAEWMNVGRDVIGSLEITLPNATDSPSFSRYDVDVTIPWSNGIAITPYIKFYNSTKTAPTTLVPVDVSLKDGKADGDPAKDNHGLQFTLGDFHFPFFNLESTSTSTANLSSIIWSEIGLPKEIRASNSYALREAAGYPTAATTIGGRYLVFKRNAFWQFIPTEDADVPIRRERLDLNIGCLGPQALDVYEDEVFFIGPSDIYRYKVGDAAPTSITGDGMREEIMNQTSTSWVEAQTTYKRPLLAIDKRQLIVWVYTQKGWLYAYDLQRQAWSKHRVSTGIEIDAMRWNSNTQNFYVSFGGYGLTRMDYTGAANDTIDNTANTYACTQAIVFKPVDLYQPPRLDACLEEVRFWHAVTASQTGQTATAYYSFDQGSTWPKSVQVTVSPLSSGGEFVLLRLPALESGASVTVKLEHVGKAGETEWSLSNRAYADVYVWNEELVQQNPTAGSATL